MVTRNSSGWRPTNPVRSRSGATRAVGLAKVAGAHSGRSQVHDANASSEAGCSRDQKQTCPDGDGPGGSRDALTGRCETFDGDGGRDDSHRVEVHDPDDQEDRHQTDTALAAVEAEAQTVLPGGTAVHGCRPGA